MKVRLKLRSKLIIGVLAVVFLAYGISVYEQFTGMKEMSKKYADNIAEKISQQSSNKIYKEFNTRFVATKEVAKNIRQKLDLPYNLKIDAIKKSLEELALKNPSVTSVWASVELRNFDPGYTKDFGRISFTYYRDNGELKYLQDTLDLVKDKRAIQFDEIKKAKSDILMEPYWFSYNKKDSILETSVGSPIIINDRFEGIVGFDFSLNSFQGVIKNIDAMKGSTSFITSAKGTIVASTEESVIGKNIVDLYKKVGKKDILTKLKQNQTFGVDVKTENGDKSHLVVIPLSYSQAKTTWAFAFLVPKSILLGDSQIYIDRIWTVAFFAFLFLISVIWFISHQITRPLKKVNETLKNLANGKVEASNKVILNTKDELNDIADSTNKLIDSLLKTVDFAKQVGNGNLAVEFQPQSKDDLLGISLLDMKKNLEDAKQQEEIRKIEDEKITWATKGIALFGELLRHNETNLEEFSYHILSNLIDYIKADVGGLFLVQEHNDGDKTIDLMACYAFDRRKYEERSIIIGEGLVGRCYQESETIFITDVPNNYMSIGSGLGIDNPTCILLVPLKLNDEVYGVIELAAFEVFERHVIDFVEKIGTTIASTISTTKVNIKTKELLEASKFQADELSAQEEEMRQNMEELIATQEESARKSREFENLMTTISAASYIIEYDIDGYVITANDAILNLLGIRSESMIGLNIKELDSYISANFGEFWNNQKRGIPAKIKSSLKGQSGNVELYQTFIPIFDDNDKVYKVMMIGYCAGDYEVLSTPQKQKVS